MKGCSRRRFLAGAGITAAACAASKAVPTFAEASPAAGKPSPIHLGLASYTFRNFSRAQMIGFMKQLNVTSLNAKDVKDHLPADPAEGDDDATIRGKFEYCKRAGIRVIVAGDPTPETLPRIEKFVKEYDIRIAIHNHGPEDKLFPSPLDVLKSIGKMDPRIGCCIDVGHTVRAGTDVVRAIREVGPRLFNVHMKDLTSFKSKESQIPVGDGLMPVREMFAALIAARYKGFVDLEYEIHADDPMPGVIASFAYMRGVLAGMGYVNHG
jgi:sugar phosphate isomerase/epimerase